MKKHETSQDSKMKLSEPKRLIWDEIIAVGPYMHIKINKEIKKEKEKKIVPSTKCCRTIHAWIQILINYAVYY